MTTRPLFDHVAAKPKRRAKSATPVIPVPPKSPPEVWVIQFCGHNRPGLAPVTCRIRKVLKNAGRCYHLKAAVIAQSPPVGAVSDSAASKPPKTPRGPEAAFNGAIQFEDAHPTANRRQK
jgi:hypothetical protein